MSARTIAIVVAMFLALTGICSSVGAQSFEDYFQAAFNYRNAGQFQNAANMYEQALRVGNPNDVNYETAEANLGYVYGQLQRFDRAEALLKSAIAKHQAREGANDGLGEIYGYLSTVYGAQQRFEECIDYARRCLEIRSKYNSLEEQNTLTMRQYLIATVAQTGNTDLAGELATELLKALEARLGPNDWRLRFSLFQIANSAIVRGKYRGADELIQRARRLPPESNQLNRLSMAIEALHVASLYMEMGRYADALDQYNRAEKDVSRKIQDNPSFKTILGAIYGAKGECLLEMGQFQQSLQLLSTNLQIMQDQNSFAAGPIYFDLGKAYERLGQFDKAEEVFRRIIATETYHIGHRINAGRQLAAILASQGKVAEADKLLEGEADLDDARDNSLIASALFAAGRLAEAEKEYRAGIEKLTQDERQFPRKQSLCWLGLAQVHDAQKKTNEALDAADKSRRLMHQLTIEMLPVFSEPEQLAFLTNEEEPAMQKALALVSKHLDDQRAVELSATWLLNRKGLAQQALSDRMLLARETNDPELAPLVADWFAVRHRLAKITVGGVDPESSDWVRKQVEQLTQREQELAAALGRAKVRQAVSTPWYELAQLRKSLPASSVYIDLMRFVPSSAKGETEYLAWIIPPEGKGNSQVVRLGKAREIDQAVSEARRHLQTPPAVPDKKENAAEKPLDESLGRLSDLLLQPILEAIAPYEHWVVCPDGTPWLFPWSALVLPDKKTGRRPYVVEKHRVSLVISGRDLIEKASSVSGNAPMMFANPDFDLFPASSAPAAPPSRALFHRGSKNRAGEIPANWTRLAGTAEEASLVAPVLQKYVQLDPLLLLGADATEAAFKAAWRPRVVLLSTHGFFLPSQKTAALENPLLRCGLVLSGANRPELRLQEDRDDGIVTGLEVLSADLRGTELVVLSACETGLGELHAGEGVAGLRQAFQLAGARGVVSTLWQIPDQETAWLMNTFFAKLAAGSDKATALQEAQKSLLLASRKNGDKAAHPYYWAAFTMTGDWRTSEVGPVTPPPDRPTVAGYVDVLVDYARVMDGSKVAVFLRSGERLPRGRQQGEWIQVFYEPGSKRSGWIHQSQVQAVQ